jgi:hypothetical protein
MREVWVVGRWDGEVGFCLVDVMGAAGCGFRFGQNQTILAGFGTFGHPTIINICLPVTCPQWSRSAHLHHHYLPGYLCGQIN